MAVAKKAVAVNKTIAKAPAPLKNSAVPKEELFAMPQQVKDWIERAGSIMKHQEGKIQSMETELKELRAYKKWATARITESDYGSRA
jgi:hypothetical protein